MERHKIQVSYRLNGMRLDHAIAESIPGLSKRRAKAIIDVGGAYLNRKRTRVASKTVGKGDQIEVEYNPALFTPQTKQQLTLKPADLLYHDELMMVINKPAGLPSQATRDQSVLHVIPALEKLLKEMELPHRDLHLVHRLDKDTTGCLVIARGNNNMTFLTDQFREKSLEKNYHALVYGNVNEDFVERCFLSAIQAHSGRVNVMKNGGKSSHTVFKVLENFTQYQVSLLNCSPITGRSHQIRVHLEKNMHPIIGDKVYGEGKRKALPTQLAAIVQHQLLHARSIKLLNRPGGTLIEVTAPYPESFENFLSQARLPLPATSEPTLPLDAQEKNLSHT